MNICVYDVLSNHVHKEKKIKLHDKNSLDIPQACVEKLSQKYALKYFKILTCVALLQNQLYDSNI